MVYENKTKTVLLCFSNTGLALALRLEKLLRQSGREAEVFCKSKYILKTDIPAACSRDLSAQKDTCTAPRSAAAVTGHTPADNLSTEEDTCDPQGADSAVKTWQGSLQEWAGEYFDSCEALIFVGAAGIAVRAVAPFVNNKRTDPAVLVLDETGKFVIPLLCGHLGGANELAQLLACETGAIPVITTATDLHQAFAVDTFAKKNNLSISDMGLAKEISAAILHGETVLLTADKELEESLEKTELPKELSHFVLRGDTLLPAADDGQVNSPDQQSMPAENKAPKNDAAGEEKPGNTGFAAQPGENMLRIHIGVRRDDMFPGRTLYLIPQAVTVGIGCRRGTSCEKIRDHVCRILEENRIFPQAVRAAASIDLKKDEPGLLQFVQETGWELQTFSAEELNEVPGEYSASDFVTAVTGVDNVCERSAILACRKQAPAFSREIPADSRRINSGRAEKQNNRRRADLCLEEAVTLIVKKTAGNGVTAACAARYQPVKFGGNTD